MGDPADELFSRFRNPGDTERHAQREQQQQRFQETCIGHILRYAGFPLALAHTKRLVKAQYGLDFLTFEWFHENFPQYPVWLSSEKMRGTAGSKIGWTDLFGRGFMRLPWLKEYQTVVNGLGKNIQTERVAMFFNAPHADKSTTMVLHNQPIQANNGVADPERRDEPETRIIRPYGNPRVTYVIESFNSFMQTVGTDWASDLCHR